jgi:hypothetical protein
VWASNLVASTFTRQSRGLLGWRALGRQWHGPSALDAHLPMEAPRGGGTMVSNDEESWIDGVEQKIAGIAEGRGGSARTEKRKGVQLFARG